jgi:hypothetical protein
MTAGVALTPDCLISLGVLYLDDLDHDPSGLSSPLDDADGAVALAAACA